MYFPYSFFSNGYISTKDLLAFYTFDNALDLGHDSLNNLNLTINGTLTSIAGKIGNAANYNTVDYDAYFSNSNTSKSFNLNNDKTFVFWFRSEEITNNSQSIFHKEDGSFTFNATERTLQWVIATDANSYSISQNFNLQNNIWYFIVLKHNMTTKTISIQVNNNIYYETVYAGTPFNDISIFRTFGFAFSPNYNTSIDSFGIWNRLLNQNETTYLYNYGNGRNQPF